MTITLKNSQHLSRSWTLHNTNLSNHESDLRLSNITQDHLRLQSLIYWMFWLLYIIWKPVPVTELAGVQPLGRRSAVLRTIAEADSMVSQDRRKGCSPESPHSDHHVLPCVARVSDSWATLDPTRHETAQPYYGRLRGPPPYYLGALHLQAW